MSDKITKSIRASELGGHHSKTISRIRRFPRFPDDPPDLAKRVAELDADALRSISRGRKACREANINTGRFFLKLKKLLGHGRWQHHFTETFEPFGIKYSTARTWMRLAKMTDFVNFPKATDAGAVKRRESTALAEAEVALAGGLQKSRRTRPDGIYELHLRLRWFATGDEQDTLDTLRKSPEWREVETQIIELLKQRVADCGLVNRDSEANLMGKATAEVKPEPSGP